MTIAACSPSPPITPGVVVFDFTEFTGIYPEFATANPAACGNNFVLATLLLSNCCSSAVFDPAVRQSLLYLLTAHITFLNTPCAANGNAPSSLVGRIDNAKEGSVSVSTEFLSTVNSAYYDQTKYGAQFWAMTAVYRTMHYIAPPSGCCDISPFASSIGPNNWN